MNTYVTAIRMQIQKVKFRSRAWKRMMLDGDELSADARVAMAQLKRFARYGKPPAVQDKTGRTDLLETGRMIGRQEVVQLIVEALNLDERVLTNMQEEFPDE